MELKRPILVTGHTGFLGSAVARRFDETGRWWIGASRHTGVDLEESSSLDSFEAGQCVVHLAGRAAILESWQCPAAFHRTNILCALTALEYARRCQVGLIYVSSYMYGQPLTEPISEDHRLDMCNPYAWSKREGEVLAESYARMFGIPVVLLRLFNVFGPNQPEHQLVPYVIQQALTGDTIFVADLVPRRDWLWAGDFATAVEAVVDRFPCGFSVYNLGTGVATSVLDVINTVLSYLGPRKIVCRNEVRQNEIPQAISDNRRFVQTFGWQPSTSVSEGIRRLIFEKERL